MTDDCTHRELGVCGRCKAQSATCPDCGYCSVCENMADKEMMRQAHDARISDIIEPLRRTMDELHEWNQSMRGRPDIEKVSSSVKSFSKLIGAVTEALDRAK